MCGDHLGRDGISNDDSSLCMEKMAFKVSVPGGGGALLCGMYSGVRAFFKWLVPQGCTLALK